MWIIAICYFVIEANGQRLLESYNVQMDDISVSGFGSGASMATQMHVAFSSTFMAVGMVGGTVYYCAENGLVRSQRCLDSPHTINAGHLVAETLQFEREGRIDDVSNLYGDKVYIFQGTADSTVAPGVDEKIREYYEYFLKASDIQVVNYINAEHGFPTVENGSPCSTEDPQFINRCQYNTAFSILQHAYGNLLRASGPVHLNGDFYEFDQRDFFPFGIPSRSSMDTTGYVYVPSGCMDRSRACRLHVAFHGCRQGRDFVGDAFVTKAGYNEIGELNDIIIMYPQATDSLNPINLDGCWDWWGYIQWFYATREGNQPFVINKMIERIASIEPGAK